MRRSLVLRVPTTSSVGGATVGMMVMVVMTVVVMRSRDLRPHGRGQAADLVPQDPADRGDGGDIVLVTDPL